MRSQAAALWLVGLAAVVPLHAQPAGETYRTDFATAWREVAATYAYFDLKATKWSEIPQLYAPDLARVSTRDEFIGLMEKVLDELYDPHAQLTVNTAASPRLVPSGTDLWAEWRGDRATVTDVRARSDAERAAIRPGSIVVAINGVPIADAVARRLGRSYPPTVSAARDWALRAVLAGTHNTPRRLLLRTRNGSDERSEQNDRTVELPAPDQFSAAEAAPLTVSARARLRSRAGGPQRLARKPRDRRRVRSGAGRTARRARAADRSPEHAQRRHQQRRPGILGRFVAREMPYQKHLLPAEERETGIRRSWLELVSPRGEFAFQQPVAILVGHWTGSMGEGLAIGFDATGHTAVIGTPMAGLLGATYHVQLPGSGIGLNLPAERLYHVNGTPREAFRPSMLVDLHRRPQPDAPRRRPGSRRRPARSPASLMRMFRYEALVAS